MSESTPRWRSMEVLTLLASFAAITISIFALTFQRRLGHETSTQTLIHDQYELCRVLDLLRVEHPEVSHMLALPAQDGGDTWKHYRTFKAQVRHLIEAEGQVTEAARSRLYLKEHAMALHVSDIYEQTLCNGSLPKPPATRIDSRFLTCLRSTMRNACCGTLACATTGTTARRDMMERDTRVRYDEKVRKAYPDEAADLKSPLEG